MQKTGLLFTQCVDSVSHMTITVQPGTVSIMLQGSGYQGFLCIIEIFPIHDTSMHRMVSSLLTAFDLCMGVGGYYKGGLGV